MKQARTIVLLALLQIAVVTAFALMLSAHWQAIVGGVAHVARTFTDSLSHR